MAGSKPPIGNTEPRLGGLRLQTSLYGQTVPVVYGRTRIPGNLLWYGGFKATRQEERSEAAKGGGSKPTRTYYEYSASVAMLLAEGPLAGVRRVYKGKQRFSGVASSTTSSTAQLDSVVPGSGPFTVTVPSASTWAFDGGVMVPTVDLLQTYFGFTTSDTPLRPGIDYTVAAGVYTFVAGLAGQPVRITYTTLTTTPGVDALAQLGLALTPGVAGQPVWQHLASVYPAEAIPYSSFAYLRAQDYVLTSAAEVENHTVEVDGFLSEIATGDAYPWAVLRDMLTNTRYGRGWASGFIGDWNQYRYYCNAYSLWISPAFTEQRPFREWITDILDATNTDAVWSGSQLKLIPRGDENLGAYVAPTTPVFDLSVDDFLASDGAMPVRVTRIGQQDVPNVVKVEFANRENDYNYEVVSAEDEASIVLYGRTEESAQTWHFFADPQSAKSAGFLRLQRAQAIRRRFAFTLPWRFVELEPGDLVTLTEPFLGLVKVPVRITQIAEKEGDEFEIEAVDFPIGHATAPIVAPQLGSGFRPDYNADPGSVAPPVFIEPPGGYTSNGLEVWAAVTGQAGAPGQYWGGAEVYASLDGGTSYKLVGRVDQGARFGVLTSALAATDSGPLDVALAGRGGKLRSVSVGEADSLVTLAFVGSTGSGEFVAFESAALTAANAYRLTKLRRGQFSTTPQAAASGSQFVYVDGSLAMSGPLPTEMIGKVVKFKFCSFNSFGGGLQSIASATEYSYTITGRFRAATDLPLSANLVPNAGFGGSTARWKFGSQAADSELAKSPVYPIRGVPSNAIMRMGGNAAAGTLMIAQSEVMPVDPGEYYRGYVDVVPWAVDAFVAIAWVDAAGQPIDYTFNANGNFVAGVAVESPVYRPDQLAHYRRSTVKAKPPAAARGATLVLAAVASASFPADGAGNRYLFPTRPFFGEIPAGSIADPPWGLGVPLVGSSGIEASAATDVYAGASGVPYNFGQSAFLRVDGPTVIADDAGWLQIDCTFTLFMAASTADQFQFRAALGPLNPNTKNSASTALLDVVGAGAFAYKTYTLTHSMQVTAGQTVNLFLNVSRVAYTAINAGGIVTKPITIYPSAGSVTIDQFRANLVKR